MSEAHGKAHGFARFRTEMHAAACGEAHGFARGLLRARAPVRPSRDPFKENISETRRSDLNAQAIIGHHAHRPGFAAVIVLPDLSPLTVELASQIERSDGSYWKLWTPWQPRQKRGRPEWVTWSEPVPAMPFRKWAARQAEITALAGGC